MNISNCKNILSRLERFLDSELPSEERERIQKHLKDCENCTLELERLKEIDAVGTAGIFPDPGTLTWEKQREIISAEIAGTRSPIHVKARERRITRIFVSRSFRIASGLSAAAAILIGISIKYINFDETIPSLYNTRRPFLIEQSGAPSVEQMTDAVTVVQAPKKPVLAVETPTAKQVDETETEQIETITEIALPPDKTDIPPDKLKEKLVLPGEKLTADEKLKLQQAQAIQNITTPVTELSQGLREQQITVTSAKRKGLFPVSSWLKMPEKNSDEFSFYLANKNIIKEWDDAFARARGWGLFLMNLKDEMVIELVVNDIYDIYNYNLYANTDKKVIGEAYEYATKYKKFLLKRMGETKYGYFITFLEALK